MKDADEVPSLVTSKAGLKHAGENHACAAQDTTCVFVLVHRCICPPAFPSVVLHHLDRGSCGKQRLVVLS